MNVHIPNAKNVNYMETCSTSVTDRQDEQNVPECKNQGMQKAHRSNNQMCKLSSRTPR